MKLKETFYTHFDNYFIKKIIININLKFELTFAASLQ